VLDNAFAVCLVARIILQEVDGSQVDQLPVYALGQPLEQFLETGRGPKLELDSAPGKFSRSWRGGGGLALVGR
jgi:hypothetical protein